jgi:WG containing repeat
MMMRKSLLRPRVRLRRLAAALCLSLLAAQPAAACSWDYLIWIPRHKDADPLYRFVQRGKAGYIDRRGKVVIEPKFNAYGNYHGVFRDGMMGLGVGVGDYADTTGEVVISGGDLSHGWEFSEGLAAAVPDDGHLWGYIDRTGEFRIKPRFERGGRGDVHSFSDGLARIKVADRYGFIDHTGEFVIEPTFLHAEDFHEGFARVVAEGPCSYFGDLPCPDPRVLGEHAPAEVPRCGFTFVDKTGHLITAERYVYAGDFSEGLAAVMRGGKWGYVDRRGRVVIEPQFDEAEPFSEGLAPVKQGKLWGYVDRAGKLSIKPRFAHAEGFTDGLAVAELPHAGGGRSGEFFYIDKSGRQAIPEKFELASPFFKGLAHVKVMPAGDRKPEEGDAHRGGGFAYIDARGKRVFTYIYTPD